MQDALNLICILTKAGILNSERSRLVKSPLHFVFSLMH